MDKPIQKLRNSFLTYLQKNDIPYESRRTQDSFKFRQMEHDYGSGFCAALRAEGSTPEKEIEFVEQFTAMLAMSGRSIVTLNPNE